MVLKNTAFLFLKPAANTAEARAYVKEKLEASNFIVTKEGEIGGAAIAEQQLIDKHYYAIASKATLVKPKDLNVPEAMFESKFGLAWKAALEKGLVFNAKDGCEKLGLDADGMDAEWAKAKKAGKLVKFGGGFYCGHIDTVAGKDPIYVMNGFFMSMRKLYVAPESSIYYYVVEWEIKNMSWEAFRAELIGPTDPATAPSDSLRGHLYANWQKLKLPAQPNVGENSIHGSASPFEALAERMNWLFMKPQTDAFGRAVQQILDAKTLNEWVKDCQVVFGSVMKMKKSIFDLLEDTDSDWCLALVHGIYHQMTAKTFSQLQDDNVNLNKDCRELKSLSLAVKNLVKVGTQTQQQPSSYSYNQQPKKDTYSQPQQKSYNPYDKYNQGYSRSNDWYGGGYKSSHY